MFFTSGVKDNNVQFLSICCSLIFGKSIISVLILDIIYFSRLQRFEKTNEMLSNCNSLSATRLERALRDFRGHTQHINGLKKELDHVFKRIRSIKSKIALQYPEAYKGKITSTSFRGSRQQKQLGFHRVDTFAVIIIFQLLEFRSDLCRKKMMNMTYKLNKRNWNRKILIKIYIRL